MDGTCIRPCWVCRLMLEQLDRFGRIGKTGVSDGRVALVQTSFIMPVQVFAAAVFRPRFAQRLKEDTRPVFVLIIKNIFATLPQ